MRFITQQLLLILGWFLISVSVFAQSSLTLQGTVQDQKGKPIEKAHIRLAGGAFSAVTDAAGKFTVSQLSAGSYEITISHIGYQTLNETIKIKPNTQNDRVFRLKVKRYVSPSVVVTATRTRRDIEEVSEPVTVISDKQIQTSGSTRLSGILAEQTGLTLTSDHGTGVQVQGLSTEYTKIMIDGQPLIGRTAGTLNLNRISVGNVQQVEMIKGPSSALWGSDALAGVINIITEQGERPFELEVKPRYGTNQTADLGLNLSAQTNGWQNDLYLNRNSSQGYRLEPNSISKTVPAYQNYTTSYQTEIPLTENITAEFQGRYYRELQNSTSFLGDPQNNPTLLDRVALQEDYSLAPSVQFDLGSGFKAEVTNYYSRYRTDTQIDYQRGDSLYERSRFDQRYNRAELQLTKRWNNRHQSIVGSGYKFEKLRAQRYAGTPSFQSYYIFTQHEWIPSRKWNLTAGFRYNSHSEYQSQLSPKLSARYDLFDWLHLRGSAGSGYKAPDFRQLFLNFTNPTVGYTVLGSSTVKQQVQQLQDRGQIDQILKPVGQLQEIRAEQSWAYNAGVDLYPTDNLELRVNLFQNSINNLIETAPIARKVNGQSVFSYFNLDEVYTRGIETQLRWQPTSGLEFSAGYQLLDARRKIEGTRTVQNESGEIIEQPFSSYKPMFNRSKHSGTIKLYYFWEALDIDANIRGTLRGPYGRIDANGNGFVDPPEYEDGYMVWDTAVAKTVKDRYTLRLGVDNVLDFSRPSDLPYLPGRIFYAQLSLQLY
jgi:outer membrane receptor for ferrienterochelin and colicins